MFHEKSHNRQIFSKARFHFRICLIHSEVIPIKKSKKNFCYFFDLRHFFQKTALAPEKSHNGKNYRNRYLHFAIRFWPILIDSDKKNFENKFCLFHFFDQKWPKIQVLKIFTQKIFPKFFPLFINFPWRFFESSYTCIPLTFIEIFPCARKGTLGSKTSISSCPTPIPGLIFISATLKTWKYNHIGN